MKIAIAQLNYTIGDIDGNASKIIDSINKAKAQRADLVIFAEQAVSGTPAFDLLRKTTFLELCEDALVEIASCCDGIAAIVGLPILTREGTISAAALIQDRKVLRYVGKKYITARREMGFLVPAHSPTPLYRRTGTMSVRRNSVCRITGRGAFGLPCRVCRRTNPKVRFREFRAGR